STCQVRLRASLWARACRCNCARYGSCAAAGRATASDPRMDRQKKTRRIPGSRRVMKRLLDVGLRLGNLDRLALGARDGPLVAAALGQGRRGLDLSLER